MDVVEVEDLTDVLDGDYFTVGVKHYVIVLLVDSPVRFLCFLGLCFLGLCCLGFLGFRFAISLLFFLAVAVAITVVVVVKTGIRVAGVLGYRLVSIPCVFLAPFVVINCRSVVSIKMRMTDITEEFQESFVPIRVS